MLKPLFILTALLFTNNIAYTENDNLSSSIQLVKSKKKQKLKEQKAAALKQLPSQPPSQANLPEPYRSVQLLPYNLEGWYGNSVQIEQIFRKHQIKVAIEVGCWAGLSTTHMAKLLPLDGKLYAIDHWEGSIEHQSLHNVSIIYEQFLSNVIWLGLTDKIVPMRMSSLEAAPKIYETGIVPDLIYIDAGHDTDSVLADLYAWFPFVKGHGILCGDDWLWASVRTAVEMFAEENHLKIKARGNFWQLVE